MSASVQSPGRYGGRTAKTVSTSKGRITATSVFRGGQSSQSDETDSADDPAHRPARPVGSVAANETYERAPGEQKGEPNGPSTATYAATQG
ncbi:hypothetical protein GCM10010306_088420 [Streptomyces umbrinus]|nr:hypothetical protein GCM10010306_088420 [Streptomyces umbrinus]